MPQLDVSEILYDPDFADQLLVLRSRQVVDSNGRAQEVQEKIQITGCAQPVGADIELHADASRSGWQLEVHTPFRLVSLTDNTAGDIVVWHSQLFLVKSIENFSQYGAGFVTALCENISMTEVPSPKFPA